MHFEDKHSILFKIDQVYIKELLYREWMEERTLADAWLPVEKKVTPIT